MKTFVLIFCDPVTLCCTRKSTQAHVHLPDENRSVTCNRLASTFPMTRIKPEFIIEYSITQSVRERERHTEGVWRNNGAAQLRSGERCVEWCRPSPSPYISRRLKAMEMLSNAHVESTHGMSTRTACANDGHRKLSYSFNVRCIGMWALA